MASHRRLASWYFQLGQSLEAGIPLLEVLAAPGGPSPRERAAMVERLRDGSALAEELAGAAAWLPGPDVHLLTAGAASGRLPAICRRLSAHHENVARLTGRAVLATLYPLAVLHLGAVLMPLKYLVLGSPLEFARQVSVVLVPLWLVGGAAAVLLLRHPGLSRRVCSLLPGVAGYQRERDLAVLATVLEGYVAAGVSVGTAWAAATQATGAPGLIALGERAVAEVEAGREPGRILGLEPLLPAEFAQTYRTGEQSGRLDEGLAWLIRRHSEAAERKLTHVSIWYPQLALLLVAAWVGVGVVRMYSDYLNDILKMLE
jgi:type II secretory pathway component PulF